MEDKRVLCSGCEHAYSDIEADTFVLLCGVYDCPCMLGLHECSDYEESSIPF